MDLKKIFSEQLTKRKEVNVKEKACIINYPFKIIENEFVGILTPKGLNVSPFLKSMAREMCETIVSDFTLIHVSGKETSDEILSNYLRFIDRLDKIMPLSLLTINGSLNKANLPDKEFSFCDPQVRQEFFNSYLLKIKGHRIIIFDDINSLFDVVKAPDEGDLMEIYSWIRALKKVGLTAIFCLPQGTNHSLIPFKFFDIACSFNYSKDKSPDVYEFACTYYQRNLACLENGQAIIDEDSAGKLIIRPYHDLMDEIESILVLRKKGLTQQAIAEKLELSQPTVSRRIKFAEEKGLKIQLTRDGSAEVSRRLSSRPNQPMKA
jgi:predicted XRE-type DNA-binding protein